MRHIKRLILFISLSFLLPIATVYAVDAGSQSINVFNFQQKLAAKGNARAQYKLATMYESGTGTERDLEQAKHWYYKASSAGIKAASDRMTYLSVKQQGYDKTKNAGWLEGIKKEAKESKGDAMFLLAQLYREGIGVKKDLDKSLEILDQVSLLGAADVENEMVLIQQEMETNDKAKKTAKKNRKIELARLASQEKDQREEEKQVEQQANSEQQKILQSKQKKEAPVATEQQVTEQTDAAKAIQAEKRQRYEKAMLKLKLEQQKIYEQQAWAAGGDTSAVDDEI